MNMNNSSDTLMLLLTSF